MKDSLSPILILLVVVLVAGWFFLPGRAHNFLSPAPGLRSADAPANPADTAKAEDSNGAAKSSKTKAAHGKDHTPELPVVELPSYTPPDESASNLTSSIAVPKAVVNSGEVPKAGEVKIGSEGSQVVHTLGAPTISAYTAEEGHSFETYVYRGDRKEAIIHLSDGRVSSVILR